MANTKISELSLASTLDGSEVLPLNQAGVTKRSTVSSMRGAMGKELAYAERVTNDTSANTSTPKDVTGLEIVINADGVTPIILEAWVFALQHTSLNAAVTVYIREGGTSLSFGSQKLNIIGGLSAPHSLRRRLVPSAGVHTYKVSFQPVQAGTATFLAAAEVPAFIRAVSVEVE